MEIFDRIRIEDLRLAQGWDEAGRSVARLLALLGWSLAALPRTGRLGRADHGRACGVLRRAEAMVRRMLVILARRRPLPTPRAARSAAPPPAPMRNIITLIPRGPLHHLLHPSPPPSPPPAPPRLAIPQPPRFRLGDPCVIMAGERGRPPPQPVHQPRIRSFGDHAVTIEITPARPERSVPHVSAQDRETPTLRHVARRLAALADVVANRERHVRRMARRLARNASALARTLRLRRLPGVVRPRPRKGRYRDPGIPDILETLHDLALRARPPPA